MPTTPAAQSMAWLVLALLTAVFWGLYGVLLHSGVMAFDPRTDPSARYKAFLFVGVAYFLTAVLAPLAMLVARGESWSFLANGRGVSWSLLAGIVGAAGAFCVLLAFGARGKPAVVMSIVFAGAPMVNAAVALVVAPPRGGWLSLRWPFVLGIVLAAVGGCLVTLYRPTEPPATPPARLAGSTEEGTR